MRNENEILNVVTVGHVDHGKSTVIGRLLADTGSLPEGKLEQVQANCRRNAKPFEYAFLLDALKHEQAQGITIDTARCFFKTEKRHYILIDAPGHIEFLKNMVTGASRAEAALMVIDASRGVEENTRRHSYFLSMLGIRQVAVLVNKMDLVDFDQKVYEAIVSEYKAFLAQIQVEPVSFIPVSGFNGDNVANHSPRMAWYSGMNLLEQLDAFAALPQPVDLPLRMPVQGVYKFTGSGDERRIIAGTVDAGTLHAGDEVVFYPSGKRTTVSTLEVFNAPTPRRFEPGQAAGFTMEQQIFVKRGELACRADEPAPKVGVRILTNIFWLGKNPFTTEKRYSLKCGTVSVPMKNEEIRRIINAGDLSDTRRGQVEKNEVAQCVLRLDRPIAFDLAGEVDSTSRFVIVDDYEIVGGGIITELLEAEDFDTRNIRWSGSGLTRQERRRFRQHDGLIVWLTGLSGSGKTTLAEAAERRLVQEGVQAFVLDGDDLRRGLNSDLGFSAEDRAENIRRTAEVAKLFSASGTVTFVTLISPFRESRAQARAIGEEGFMEVYVKADVAACEKRDPKGLYAKARAGRIAGFTGIDAPYETPEHPELILDTETMEEDACVEALLQAIMARI